MPQSSLPDRTYYIDGEIISVESQCTYRCVVLPDDEELSFRWEMKLSQCTYRCVVLPDLSGLDLPGRSRRSQCTYRCVVLPYRSSPTRPFGTTRVSMHLQVRGAP